MLGLISGVALRLWFPVSDAAWLGGVPVIEDAKGERITMTDTGMTEEPPSCHLLHLVPREMHENQTLVARFRHDLDKRTLQIKPLCIVTGTGVVRLTL